MLSNCEFKASLWGQQFSLPLKLMRPTPPKLLVCLYKIYGVKKDEDKDKEKDADTNKDLMKKISVYSLLYPYLPSPKLPTSVTLPLSKLIELINNLSSASSSFYFSLSI